MIENSDEHKSKSLIYYQEMFLIGVLPVLHLIGIMSNIICGKIFSSLDNFKTSTFKLLTANSIVSAIFLLAILFTPFTQCINLCEPWLSVYFTMTIRKYIAMYVCRLLDTTSTLINITIVIDQYLCIRNIRLKKRNRVIIGTVLLYVIVSATLFSPNLFFHNIKLIIDKNDTRKVTYIFEETSFSRNNLTKTAIISIQHIISIVCIIVVIIVNILLLNKLYERLRGMNRDLTKFVMVKSAPSSAKFSMKARGSSTKNKSCSNGTTVQPEIVMRYSKKKTVSTIEKQTTIMVVMISVIYLINQISTQCFNTAFIFIDTKSKIVLINFSMIAYNFCAYIFHGTNIFIYYYFNGKFALELKKLFYK